ncbi:MAG TPA: TetR/AcrR family transcriptional regulator [Solirubrobacterales bacterium]|jgi:AcrR family transcriptional regulator|nr:TetR/AcrR family transcriptional regulator [Solirubrobacterales bacterium]
MAGSTDGRGAGRGEQRELLFAAIVACCSRKGFEATSVADLLEVSGVSRRTFYSQFEDKLDCFRAAEEELIGTAVETVRRQLNGGGSAEQRARGALAAFVELIVSAPAAARICFVEAYAAGEPGVAPVRDAVELVARLGRETLEQIPGREGMPAELSRAIVASLYQVVRRRLQSHRESELSELVPALWDWAMSYRTPPLPLRRGGRRGKRAPAGTMPPFAAHSVEQRAIRALAAVVAEKGYPATTIADIAAAAAVSQTTFYAHFADKADALAAALDSSGAQMLAATLPSARRAPDWPTAVRIAFEATCGFLAAEPAFARLRMVDVYSAGPQAIAIRDQAGTELLATLLGPAFSDRPAIPEVVLEAITGAVYGIFYERIRGGATADLPAAAPLLTYIALAPFLGAERACEVANSGPAPRRRAR